MDRCILNRTVTDYHGVSHRIECEEGEKDKLQKEILIDPFVDDFEIGWISGTMAEVRIKEYLSYVATLMIRDPDKNNIQSDKKINSIKSMEIEVVNVDIPPKNVSPRKDVPKPRKEPIPSRYDRIEEIKKTHPEGKFAFARVDTNGDFGYGGRRFHISNQVEAYQPRATNTEPFYEMDKIMVLDAGRLFFFDQSLKEISKEYITWE